MGGVGEMYPKSLDHPNNMLQSEFGSCILSKVKMGRGISYWTNAKYKQLSQVDTLRIIKSCP